MTKKALKAYFILAKQPHRKIRQKSSSYVSKSSNTLVKKKNFNVIFLFSFFEKCFKRYVENFSIPVCHPQTIASLIDSKGFYLCSNAQRKNFAPLRIFDANQNKN